MTHAGVTGAARGGLRGGLGRGLRGGLRGGLLGALLAAAPLASGIACHRARTSAGVPSATAADSARGIVQVTGSEPVTSVVLSAPGGYVALQGAEADRLRPLAGVEAVAMGTRLSAPTSPGSRAGDAMIVARFVVRAVDGVPAIDGVVASVGSGFAIVTADGVRHAAPHLPTPLQSRVGARVYLAGPLGSPPTAYGVIPPP